MRARLCQRCRLNRSVRGLFVQVSQILLKEVVVVAHGNLQILVATLTANVQLWLYTSSINASSQNGLRGSVYDVPDLPQRNTASNKTNRTNTGYE